jgi:hypothetical protein
LQRRKPQKRKDNPVSQAHTILGLEEKYSSLSFCGLTTIIKTRFMKQNASIFYNLLQIKHYLSFGK